jgi:hypothetical protein
MQASDNRIYGATLIMPPDMEAVQRAYGTMYRVVVHHGKVWQV